MERREGGLLELNGSSPNLTLVNPLVKSDCTSAGCAFAGGAARETAAWLGLRKRASRSEATVSG